MCRRSGAVVVSCSSGLPWFFVGRGCVESLGVPAPSVCGGETESELMRRWDVVRADLVGQAGGARAARLKGRGEAGSELELAGPRDSTSVSVYDSIAGAGASRAAAAAGDRAGTDVRNSFVNFQCCFNQRRQAQQYYM